MKGLNGDTPFLLAQKMLLFLQQRMKECQVIRRSLFGPWVDALVQRAYAITTRELNEPILMNIYGDKRLNLPLCEKT